MTTRYGSLFFFVNLLFLILLVQSVLNSILLVNFLYKFEESFKNYNKIFSHEIMVEVPKIESELPKFNKN